MEENQFFDAPAGVEKETKLLAEMIHDNVSDSSSIDENETIFFKEIERIGITLNKPQKKAVSHYQGPILTIAGAGSGKTSVIVCRTGYLLSVKGVQARNLLLVTFTKKAAEEMKQRLSALPRITQQITNQLQARTFHSFFLFLLRHQGYNQVILNNERYKQIIIKLILKEMNLGDTYQPENILALYSNCKMNMFTIEDMPTKSPSDKDVKGVFRKYEEWKKQQYQWDYDDILVEAYHLLQSNESLLKSIQDRFQYVMVDEFQDTNLLQYELIKMIVKKHHNIFVVGDDDQTIYSFNGARNDIILNFDKEFPNTKTVTLDINYRSTNSIVGLGNELIKYNSQRKEKTLKVIKESRLSPQFGQPLSTDDEAQWVITQIQKKVSDGTHEYRDFAILHRTASNSRAIFEQLTLDDIPFISFSVSDQLFYDQWIVKPVVDYLRLSMDPRNIDSIESILPSLYINKEKGIEYIKRREAEQRKKYPLSHLASMPGIKEFQAKKMKDRIKFVKDLQERKPIDAIQEIRSYFYDNFIDATAHENSLHKETMRESLDELEASAKRFSSIPNFLTFIEEMKIKNEEMKNNKNKSDINAVSLMTIHRSKGLEFPTVFIIGASEGILPHISALEAEKMDDVFTTVKSSKEKIKLALEEERRLMYVAITRAKEELYVTSPSYYRGKKASVSRFLLEAYKVENKEGGKKSSDSGRTYQVKSKQKETVLAWLCKNKDCNAWQRVLTYEDTILDTKPCPLCGSSMEKGPKVIAI
ncbi:UvrD-helicase domain-containing protein [Evansella sp. AB-rgal1]|uniref:UvrD-helicase domain-containing protein n=1 Tax=Evansella sp. AB-rgal1 TaxID=3242696 RepID=UPI00359E49C7